MSFPKANFSSKQLSEYIKNISKDLIIHCNYKKCGYLYCYLEENNQNEEYLEELSKGSVIKINHHIKKEKEKILISEEFRKIVHRWVRTYYYEQSFPTV